MSNYSKTTDFEAKDSLPTGDSGKIIRGSEFETEFDAISTAIATKADTAGPTFTGTLTFETISDGTINVTAFVDEDNMASNSATLIPTQQSVKAYVDSQLTAQDLDFQADSGGALSIDLDSETMTFTGGTGIDTSGSGNAVTFAIDSTVATLAGSQTLTNKSLTAPTLTGTAVVASLDISGDIDVDGTTNLDVVDIDGAVDFASTTAHAGNASFADNARAIFGAGSDLQIYHSGSHSFIEDAGTGNLKIKTNTLRIENAAGTELSATFVQDGAVTLYNDNSIKLATTSTGIDVTGTVTADGLTVDGSATINSAAPVLSLTETDTTDLNTLLESSSGNFNISTRSDDGGTKTKRLRVTHSTGDVSFYEDTGTTPKMFWDASAERLGIGTTSPQATLDVDGFIDIAPSSGDAQLDISNSANTGRSLIYFSDPDGTGGRILFNHATNAMSFETNGTSEAMRIDSSGRVGIGTTSPTRLLHVRDTSSQTVAIFDGAANSAGEIGFRASGTSGDTYVTIGAVANDMVLSAGANERVRINSSGNVGIGTSSPSSPLDVIGELNVGVASDRLRLNSSTATAIVESNSSDSLILRAKESGAGISFQTGGTSQRMKLTSDGKLGIGTNSPSAFLNTKGDDALLLQSTNSDNYGFHVTVDHATDMAKLGALDSADGSKDGSTITFGDFGRDIRFSTNKGASLAEAMRIAPGGTVMVGKTSSNVATVGVELRQDGTTTTTASGTAPLVVNRTTSDGNVAEFRKDGNAIGNIASVGGADIKVAFSSDGDQYITGNAASNYLSFSSANAERVRIDSSGNLLVGTTATSVSGDGARLMADGQARFAKASDTVMLLNRNTTDGTIAEFRKDNSSVGSIGVNESDLYIGTGDTTLRFADGADSIVPRGTNGATRDAAVALGNSANRFSNLTLSGGVFLGGTATANKLDDYEEGTWTPEIADANTGGNTGTASTIEGAYTKIGRMVALTFRALDIDTTGMTTPNGLRIRGLPFTSGSGIKGIAEGTVRLDGFNVSDSTVNLSVQILSGSSYLLIRQTRDNDTDSSVTVGMANSGSADIFGTLTYFIN